MKRRILTILWPLLVGFPLVQPAVAQSALYEATLSTAIANTTDTHIILSNWAGITVPGPNNSQLKNLLIDGELFEAIAIDPPGTNYISVRRAVRGTGRATHASGAHVWAGPTAAFVNNDPLQLAGCTRTDFTSVPIIALVSRGTWDCMGGIMVRTDQPGASYNGSAIASSANSGVVTPPAETFKISGTSAVNTFVTPAGWAAGHCLNIVPTGNFTLIATTGNIGKAATAVTGRVMKVCYGGGTAKLWYPSY